MRVFWRQIVRAVEERCIYNGFIKLFYLRKQTKMMMKRHYNLNIASISWITPSSLPPGGYFHQNRTWMCLPDLENLTFSIPIFCLIYHPSVYHFRKKSTQFCPNLVLFTIICPKIHRIYVIWASSSLMNPPPRSLYQISRKSAPKGRHIYVYHVKVRTPLPNT